MKRARSNRFLLILIISVLYFGNMLLSNKVVFAKDSYGNNIGTKAIKYLAGNIIAQETTRTVTSLSVEPESIVVQKGETKDVKVYAIYKDSPSTKEDVTENVTAKVSSGNIVTVDHGTVTAVSKGKATVTYSFGGKTAKLSVKAVPSIDHIAVSATETTLEAGKSVSLKATAYYSDESSEDITSIADWTTEDEEVATISRGTISAKSDAEVGGNTTVNVTYLDQTISINVTIVKAVKKLTADKTSVVFPVYGTKEITLTATYSDGTTASITEAAAATSSNTAVATVEGGVITAVSTGSAQVTFAYGSKNVKVSVTVKKELKILAIAPSILSMETGDTAKVKATATYTDDKTEDVTKYVDWSSSDSNSLSISQGVITAKSKSDNPVTITAVYGLQDEAASIPVIVTPAVKTLTSDVQSSVSITKGQTLEVTLTAKYVNISLPSEDVTSKAASKSANTSIASVDSNGITGVALGTTKITYSYGSKTLTISVTVRDNPDKISVNAASVILESDGKATLKVTAYYLDDSTSDSTDYTTEDITKLVSYKLADTDIAKVSQGVITSLGTEGDTVLTINYGNSDPIELNVKVLNSDETVSSLDTNTILTVGIGETASPIVTAVLSDKSWANVSNNCIWQSSNDKVLSIDPSTGTIKGLKEGTATITVNFCSQSSTIDVKVTPP